MKVGKKLQKVRLEKGITLIEIQEKSRVSIANLEALEKDDYQALGSDYNVKTVIRAYANMLGLNADQLIQQYENGDEIPEVEPSQLHDEVTATRSKHSKKNNKDNKIIPIIILAIVFIVMVGSVAYAFIKESNRFNANSDVQKEYKVENHADDKKDELKEPDKKEESKEQPAPAPVSSAPASSSKPEEKIELLSDSGSQAVVKVTNIQGNAELKLKGTNGRCWVNVVANGQSLYQGIVEMNYTKTISIPDQTAKVTIKTGNAPALAMNINDKDIALSNQNAIKQKTITINLEYLKS